MEAVTCEHVLKQAPLQVLHAALDRTLGYGPAYEGQMSNHLPMALHAAWEMGADAERLNAQIAHDAPRLERAPALSPADLDEVQTLCAASNRWQRHLGRTESAELLRAYFDAQLQRHPAEEVMATHLPALLPGAHAFALHGLIRVAHAWETGHRQELAAALASWAAWWEVLPAGTPVEPSAQLDLTDWAARLREEAQGWRSDRPMILLRMQEASRTALYADLAERLQPAAHLADRQAQLHDWAVQAYLHSRNFTLLHVITGLRALRVLLPLLKIQGPGLAVQAVLARTVVAGWMAGRVQWQTQAFDEPVRPWRALHQEALAQGDEHVLKLVHTCWQEDARRPDRRWRQVAALVLRRT